MLVTNGGTNGAVPLDEATRRENLVVAEQHSKNGNQLHSMSVVLSCILCFSWLAGTNS